MLVCGRKDGAEKVGSNHRGGVSPLFLLVVACSDLQDLVLLLGLVKCLSVKLNAHCSLFFTPALLYSCFLETELGLLCIVFSFPIRPPSDPSTKDCRDVSLLQGRGLRSQATACGSRGHRVGSVTAARDVVQT